MSCEKKLGYIIPREKPQATARISRPRRVERRTDQAPQRSNPPTRKSSKMDGNLGTVVHSFRLLFQHRNSSGIRIATNFDAGTDRVSGYRPLCRLGNGQRSGWPPVSEPGIDGGSRLRPNSDVVSGSGSGRRPIPGTEMVAGRDETRLPPSEEVGVPDSQATGGARGR